MHVPPLARRPVKAAVPARRAVAEVPLEDFHFSINMMLFGYPGAGKTVLAGTAPNAVILGTEPGVISAKRAGSTASLVRIGDSTDAWTWLEDAQNGKYAHRDWVILDTITMLQNKFMKSTLQDMVKRRPDRDVDLPDKPEHQKMQNELKRWYEQFIDLPMNTLTLAHAMRVEDQDGGVIVMPTIEGGAAKGYTIANYAMALVNAVGYIGVRTVKTGETTKEVRRILWRPTHDPVKDILYMAKDHFAVFGRRTDDVTMPELLDMIGTGPKRRVARR
jgi:AAA domain